MQFKNICSLLTYTQTLTHTHTHRSEEKKTGEINQYYNLKIQLRIVQVTSPVVWNFSLQKSGVEGSQRAQTSTKKLQEMFLTLSSCFVIIFEKATSIFLMTAVTLWWKHENI